MGLALSHCPSRIGGQGEKRDIGVCHAVPRVSADTQGLYPGLGAQWDSE